MLSLKAPVLLSECSRNAVSKMLFSEMLSPETPNAA
jgi:hypothetical protein